MFHCIFIQLVRLQKAEKQKYVIKMMNCRVKGLGYTKCKQIKLKTKEILKEKNLLLQVKYTNFQFVLSLVGTGSV